MKVGMRMRICIGLLLGLTGNLMAQELKEVNLGVVEGEFRELNHTVFWKNNRGDTARLNLWSSADAIIFSNSKISVGPSDTAAISFKIEMPKRVGDHEFEIRLLDAEDLIVDGYQISFKMLQAEVDEFEAYRNIFWPIRSKEQVFNLKAGLKGEMLSSSFQIYNLSGAELDLTEVSVSDSVSVAFEPQVLGHNQFGTMRIDYKSSDNSISGFQKRMIHLLNNDQYLTSIPIQYTVLPRPSLPSDNSPKLALSKISHDFKVVKVGDVVFAEIRISNTGKENLLIEKIESNCDCLNYRLNEDPLEAGESRIINVEFNAEGRRGLERKTLAIFSNDPKRPTQVITFRAHVK